VAVKELPKGVPVELECIALSGREGKCKKRDNHRVSYDLLLTLQPTLQLTYVVKELSLLGGLVKVDVSSQET
jgi:hypothetical protein